LKIHNKRPIKPGERGGKENSLDGNDKRQGDPEKKTRGPNPTPTEGERTLIKAEPEKGGVEQGKIVAVPENRGVWKQAISNSVREEKSKKFVVPWTGKSRKKSFIIKKKKRFKWGKRK